MGTLNLNPSTQALIAEYERICRQMLKYAGDKPPEWQPDDVLDVDAYLPASVRLAARNWRRKMVQEHNSSALFAMMIPQLIEAEADVAFKMATLRSSMDELRHGVLCSEVVRYLGGDPVVQTNLKIAELPPHPDVGPLETALRNVLFVGCLSETVAVAFMTEQREQIEDPYIRRVNRQLLGDESLHARLGWIYLADVLPQLDAAGLARTNAYLAVALGYYEACMEGETADEHIDSDVLADALKLGFSHGAQAKEVFNAAMEAVILPQLQATGLAADEAWANRTVPKEAPGRRTVM